MTTIDDIRLYQEKCLNRRIVDVQKNKNADEGMCLFFDDGTRVDIGYCGCEGTIEFFDSCTDKAIMK